MKDVQSRTVSVSTVIALCLCRSSLPQTAVRQNLPAEAGNIFEGTLLSTCKILHQFAAALFFRARDF